MCRELCHARPRRTDGGVRRDGGGAGGGDGFEHSKGARPQAAGGVSRVHRSGARAGRRLRVTDGCGLGHGSVFGRYHARHRDRRRHGTTRQAADGSRRRAAEPARAAAEVPDRLRAPPRRGEDACRRAAHTTPLSIVTLGATNTKRKRILCTASAALLDTRSGYCYGLAEATKDHEELQNAWKTRDEVDLRRRDVELKAFTAMLGELERTWGMVVREHATAARGGARYDTPG